MSVRVLVGITVVFLAGCVSRAQIGRYKGDGTITDISSFGAGYRVDFDESFPLSGPRDFSFRLKNLPGSELTATLFFLVRDSVPWGARADAWVNGREKGIRPRGWVSVEVTGKSGDLQARVRSDLQEFIWSFSMPPDDEPVEYGLYKTEGWVTFLPGRQYDVSIRFEPNLTERHDEGANHEFTGSFAVIGHPLK